MYDGTTTLQLYAERWLDRVNDFEGIGTYLLNKHGQKLFRRSIRGVDSNVLFECEFADNMALLATTCRAS